MESVDYQCAFFLGPRRSINGGALSGPMGVPYRNLNMSTAAKTRRYQSLPGDLGHRATGFLRPLYNLSSVPSFMAVCTAECREYIWPESSFVTRPASVCWPRFSACSRAKRTHRVRHRHVADFYSAVDRCPAIYMRNHVMLPSQLWARPSTNDRVASVKRSKCCLPTSKISSDFED
ncbi:hypothetical protein MMA231_02825 [Asticcacaulis sp. MM231]